VINIQLFTKSGKSYNLAVDEAKDLHDGLCAMFDGDTHQGQLTNGYAHPQFVLSALPNHEPVIREFLAEPADLFCRSERE